MTMWQKIWVADDDFDDDNDEPEVGRSEGWDNCTWSATLFIAFSESWLVGRYLDTFPTRGLRSGGFFD